MKTSIHFSNGRFDFCSNGKQDQLVLSTKYGRVSALWGDGECEYKTDTLPSEAASMIRERLSRYLWMSGRDEKIAILNEIDKHSAEIDRDYLLDSAEKLEVKAKIFREMAFEIEVGS